jgi:ketosteroid isomerase-like protein
MSSASEELSPGEVVEAVYRAFETRDVESLFNLFAEDVVIYQSEELPWGGTHQGHDGAAKFFGTLMSHISSQVEVDRFIVAGDTVVEIGRTNGEALGSGNGFSIDEAHVFKVEGGKVKRMDSYIDNEAMLKALSD